MMIYYLSYHHFDYEDHVDFCLIPTMILISIENATSVIAIEEEETCFAHFIALQIIR